MPECQEVTAETLFPIRDKEYYYDEIGRYMRRPYLVENWCRQNDITASRFQTGEFEDWWHVPNEEDRVMFVLRWSSG